MLKARNEVVREAELVCTGIAEKFGERYARGNFAMVPWDWCDDIMSLGYSRAEKDIIVALIHEIRPENGFIVWPSLETIARQGYYKSAKKISNHLEKIVAKGGLKVLHGERGRGESNFSRVISVLLGALTAANEVPTWARCKWVKNLGSAKYASVMQSPVLEVFRPDPNRAHSRCVRKSCSKSRGRTRPIRGARQSRAAREGGHHSRRRDFANEVGAGVTDIKFRGVVDRHSRRAGKSRRRGRWGIGNTFDIIAASPVALLTPHWS